MRLLCHNDFIRINNEIHKLILRGAVNPHIGEAKMPVSATIRDVNKHALKHGVTWAQAQGFVDAAVIMFDHGGRSLYISHEGNAVLLDENSRLISAYPKDKFDPAVWAILEVVYSG